MLLQRASFNWAYSEDIPGSRCGPEDGPWPRPYQVLDEEEVWRELKVLAKPQSFMIDSKRGWRADSINFQPSPKTKTQDRYVVTQLNILGRQWTLTGVFDGHLGDVTVEHVAHHLPIIVREFLQKALAEDPTPTPALIADLFSRSIVAFDNAIAKDVLDLFGGIEGLNNFTDGEVRNIINDQHSGGANWKKARLCMYGTTALVALVDPDHQNLWIANVGDCQAIMVYPGQDTKDWKFDLLTASHNGDNDAEVDRVRKAHPNETECIIDRRVLGALAPTRCLGDIPFKQPPEFTRRILYNLFPGFHNTSPWEEFLVRNRTPPYITAEPEVTHRRLDNDSTSPRYLILASDGFADLCDGEGQQRIVESWANGMLAKSSKHEITELAPGSKSDNMALGLLRRAVGGDDRFSVSRVLTLDMDVAWIDDTSIVVQTL
ncbi:phosphatase 2C-like domain-containing protein [Crucibulum laeve]|uniref:Phosphatase 2C-like domain-containing protein n=1 Tax=Crucibulum laeve TaxID=68775 RepID=A0A5C3LPD1_9AGAR|nr:phosphatase 2C-like domain-containing protein [Crucibulum laeve]